MRNPSWDGWAACRAAHRSWRTDRFSCLGGGQACPIFGLPSSSPGRRVPTRLSANRGSPQDSGRFGPTELALRETALAWAVGRFSRSSRKRSEAKTAARDKGRANETLSGPMGARSALPGKKFLSPTGQSQASTKPTSWTCPTHILEWIQPHLSENLKLIKGLAFGEAPSANVVPEGVLRHLPKGEKTFLSKVFNAVLRRQYFPPSWKHTHVVPILRPGKDPTLPFPYNPTSLLDTAEKSWWKTYSLGSTEKSTSADCCSTSSLYFYPGAKRHCSCFALLKKSTEIFTRVG
jgi:hypothetical protein